MFFIKSKYLLLVRIVRRRFIELDNIELYGFSFAMQKCLPFVRPRLLEEYRKQETNKAEPHRSGARLTDQSEDFRPPEELKNFFNDLLSSKAFWTRGPAREVLCLCTG